MSNAFAIAAVSAVLKDLLNAGIADGRLDGEFDPAPTVSAFPPDRIKVGEAELPQINLFFYHATPNASWRNVGLPSRNDSGDLVTNAPLALDLSYLLTAYGKKPLDCEILLGYAMQVLHDMPVLPRDAIRKVLSSDQQPRGLKVTGLADQIEQIKITPQVLNTEEISKLWTAMQAHYRPSAAYHVSVVLIEGEKPTRVSLPVAQRNIQVLSFRQPVIEEVDPTVVVTGQTLTLRGRNLQAEDTRLNFGMSSLVGPDKIDDQNIVVSLQSGLLAGVNTVQVVQRLVFGTPGAPHRGFESNAVPFILAPRITTQQSLTVKRGETLTLDIDPPVGSTQRVALLLGDYSIVLRPRPEGNPLSKLDFPIPSDLPVGQVPIRVQIDGAQSLLDIDQDPNSSTFGQFTGTPSITITQ